MSFIPGQVLTAALLNAAIDACVKTGQVSTFMLTALAAIDSPSALLALGATDGTGKLLSSLFPTTLSGRDGYQGTWNASTNVPSISSGSASSSNNGNYYIVTTAGSTTVDGTSSWAVGDWIRSNGSTWAKIGNVYSAVSSVAGRTGAVTLTSADLTDATTVGKALLTAATVTAQRTALGLGSAALLTAGTGANNAVQLDASSKLPAVDGSQLTNLAVSGRLLRAPQVLTSGTSYTTPAGCNAIFVELVGGGGGSGGTGAGPAASPGAGAGGYAAKYFTVSPSTAYTIAIGAAGSAGSTSAAGTAGGNTTITVGGTTVTAGGGGLGSAGGSGAVAGGTGGTATNGDINIPGQAGGSIPASATIGGHGGSTKLGLGGVPGVNVAGAAGTGYGAGASGPQAASTAKAGAAGTGGMIRVWEYA